MEVEIGGSTGGLHKPLWGADICRNRLDVFSPDPASLGPEQELISLSVLKVPLCSLSVPRPLISCLQVESPPCWCRSPVCTPVGAAFLEKESHLCKADQTPGWFRVGGVECLVGGLPKLNQASQMCLGKRTAVLQPFWLCRSGLGLLMNGWLLS